MSNQNAHKLAVLRLNLSSRQPRAMADIAKIAREFFRAGFKKEGWDSGGGLKKWPGRDPAFSGKRRQLLRNSGNLFNNIRSWSGRQKAVVYNSTKYGSLQNDGGNMTVTLGMRRFFWAKYYEELNKGNKADAAIWKNMALKKAGSVIKVPARPFIYDSRTLEKKVERYIDQFIKQL